MSRQSVLSAEYHHFRPNDKPERCHSNACSSTYHGWVVHRWPLPEQPRQCDHTYTQKVAVKCDVVCDCYARLLCTSSFCVEVTRKNRGECSAFEQLQLVVSSLCEMANSWRGRMGWHFGDAQYKLAFVGHLRKKGKSRLLWICVNKQSQHKRDHVCKITDESLCKGFLRLYILHTELIGTSQKSLVVNLLFVRNSCKS